MARIDALFDELLHLGGSDLHLAVGYPPLGRIKGELTPLRHTAMERPELDAMLDELLDDRLRQRFADTLELDFAHAHGQRARFRANYMQKTTGPGAVFRTIPSRIPTAEELGLPPAIIRLAERTAGLVLVTGPTGSGKSTTLAAMIAHVNHTRDGHILTIEDPIEFVHPPARCLVTQREIGVDAPTFADAIRSASRENADVILVGELRGPETMRLALQLASFGVLVFATVHTNSAGATIDRFVNAFSAAQQPQIRGMLADALGGVVAQQLLRRADGTGRIAAHEILVGNTAVGAIIREAKPGLFASLMQAGRKDGMQTMDAALEELVDDDVITATDALARASDKDAFARVPAVAARLAE